MNSTITTESLSGKKMIKKKVDAEQSFSYSDKTSIHMLHTYC
ncbi:hypothetical protein [Staphylococcus simulans]|nr:hypothetical protein [Staphylococcus simulans]